jgi:quercetin dioxygenase-like cupin family protein/enamine deaminase RidA (YjgF/YER057c/UK114 family)
MDIKRTGSDTSGEEPAEYFTGTVHFVPLIRAPDPARVQGASVTFEPGARTAWHTHPLGQNLIVTAGCGWAQREGGLIEEIHPGDVVWFSPNEKHWHGATPSTSMTHIAIQERLDGKTVQWMEKVSDEQYQAPSESNSSDMRFMTSSQAKGSFENSKVVSAERRLNELGLKLPIPPEPFGTYVEAVQTGNLLFLTGMLPTEGRQAKFIGRVGEKLDVQTGSQAAQLAALNAMAVAREHLGSLDRIARIVRLDVFVATSGDVREQPQVADGASQLLQDVFGKDRNPCRAVCGVASLPLGAPVAVEIIFEIGD